MVRSYTSQGYQAILGGIHTHKPHLALYYEADGFHVLSPGAPLVLHPPIGRIQWPVDAPMRPLARPLIAQVPYKPEC